MRCYDSAYMEHSVVVGPGGAGFVWRLPGCFQAWPSEKPHDSWTHQRPADKDQQDALFTERQLFKETQSETMTAANVVVFFPEWQSNDTPYSDWLVLVAFGWLGWLGLAMRSENG